MLLQLLKIISLLLILHPAIAQKSCFVEPILKQVFSLDRSEYIKTQTDLRIANNGRMFSLFGWFRLDEDVNRQHPILRVIMKHPSQSAFTQANHDNFLKLNYDNSTPNESKLIIQYLKDDDTIETLTQVLDIPVGVWVNLAYTADYQQSNAKLVLQTFESNPQVDLEIDLSLDFVGFNIPQIVEIDYGCFNENPLTATVDDLQQCSLASFRDFSTILEYIDDLKHTYLLVEYNAPESFSNIVFDQSNSDQLLLLSNATFQGNFNADQFNNGVIFLQGNSLQLSNLPFYNQANRVNAPSFRLKFSFSKDIPNNLLLLRQSDDNNTSLFEVILNKRPNQENWSVVVGLSNQQKFFRLNEVFAPNQVNELTVSVIKVQKQSFFYIKANDQAEFSPDQGDIQLANGNFELFDASLQNSGNVRMVQLIFMPNSGGVFLDQVRVKGQRNDLTCREKCIQKINVDFQQIFINNNQALLQALDRCLVCSNNYILDANQLVCRTFCPAGQKNVDNVCIQCQTLGCSEIQQDLVSVTVHNDTTVEVKRLGRINNFDPATETDDLIQVNIPNASSPKDYNITRQINSVRQTELYNFNFSPNRTDLQNQNITFSVLSNDFYDVNRNLLQPKTFEIPIQNLKLFTAQQLTDSIITAPTQVLNTTSNQQSTSSQPITILPLNIPTQQTQSVNQTINQTSTPSQNTTLIPIPFNLTAGPVNSTINATNLTTASDPTARQNNNSNQRRDPDQECNLERLGSATFAFILLGLLAGILGTLFKCPHLPYKSFLYQKFVQLLLIAQYVAFWLMFNHQTPANLRSFLKKIYETVIDWHSIFPDENDQVWHRELFAPDDIQSWNKEDELTHFTYLFSVIFIIQAVFIFAYIIIKILTIIANRPKKPQVIKVDENGENRQVEFNQLGTDVHMQTPAKQSIFQRMLLPLFEWRVIFTVFLVFTVECFVFIFLNWYRWNHDRGVFVFSLIVSVVYFIIMLGLIAMTLFKALPISYNLNESQYESKWGFIYEALELRTPHKLFQGIQYIYYAVFALFFVILNRENVAQGIVTLILSFLFFAYIVAIRPPVNSLDKIEQVVTHFLLFIATLLMTILVMDWDTDDDKSKNLGQDDRWNMGLAIVIILFILFVFNALWMLFRLFQHIMDCRKYKKEITALEQKIKDPGYFHVGPTPNVIMQNVGGFGGGIKPDTDESIEWVTAQNPVQDNFNVNQNLALDGQNDLRNAQRIELSDNGLGDNQEVEYVDPEHLVINQVQREANEVVKNTENVIGDTGNVIKDSTNKVINKTNNVVTDTNNLVTGTTDNIVIDTNRVIDDQANRKQMIQKKLDSLKKIEDMSENLRPDQESEQFEYGFENGSNTERVLQKTPFALPTQEQIEPKNFNKKRIVEVIDMEIQDPSLREEKGVEYIFKQDYLPEDVPLKEKKL